MQSENMNNNQSQNKITSETPRKVASNPHPRPTNGTQPHPANGTQPRTTNGAQPRPANGAQPRPTNGPQPRPANGAQPRPANGAQPRPANGAQPRPVNGAQPRPSNGAQPRPANSAQPRPVNGAQPRPVNGAQPRSANGAPVPKRRKKKETLKQKVLRITGQVALCLVTAIVVLAATLFISLNMMCSDSSPAAQRMFVTTILETGQLKFLASWFLSPEEIQEIVNTNSMEEFNEAVDDSLINVGGSGSISVGGNQTAPEEDIQVIEISGATFYGNLIIVKDPSRVSVASIFPWKTEGVTLDKLVNDNNAIAGINGGLYNSYNNSGGMPYGVVVSNGEIQYNEPQQFPGLVLIGLTEDNILQIIDVSKMTPKDVENLVRDKKIRDAVTFQEESSDSNNHFVQLLINGEARELNGMGSGLNPRTAIGQRADGALLLFVTDGRGKSGHLGASASDLINVMLEYGAVNAANLDGGSSSCMYYNGEYLMTSVTFYYSNASWKLPLAFIVK